ncbi:MAG: bifunctional adenosylcobinamide kinase/adenosylcobinamide-phosphate guanylyltransferase [Alphaproteobacteria bacterium]|nr:bifunctional adenosylcobinamide kinase/adenosylcobinamide-phosphate guanylyltransferase [Alphaproteobacteria bacterium]
MITLILGGASSGKSLFAEQFTLKTSPIKNYGAQRYMVENNNRHYIATYQTIGNDLEMADKIERHRQRRLSNWTTHEVPLDLVSKLSQLTQQDEGLPILVECLNMWVTNMLENKIDIGRAGDALAQLCQYVSNHAKNRKIHGYWEGQSAKIAPIIFVSLEVGLGIVPDNALARQYRDALGTLNQQIAAIAEKVILVVAGQPLYIKGQK